MKIWDDKGIACFVKSDIKNHLERVGETELFVISEIAKPEFFKLLSRLNCHGVISKEILQKETELENSKLNEMLIFLIEKRIIEHHTSNSGESGYKLTAYRGIIGYLILAMGYVLSKSVCSTSEYMA